MVLLAGACAVGPRREAGSAALHCLRLDRAACFAAAGCEAVPYWGESLVACDVDERGFSTNCPWEGCRPAGADCPELAELLERCPGSCGTNEFAIDPATGCRTCECRRP